MHVIRFDAGRRSPHPSTAMKADDLPEAIAAVCPSFTSSEDFLRYCPNKIGRCLATSS